MPPPQKSQEERAADIAQKSESMARELSQKREMRIRQERVRQLSDEDAGRRKNTPRPSKIHDDRTVRQPEGDVRDTRVLDVPANPPFHPERRLNLLDDVATELEELLRDLRAGWHRFAMADRLTFLASCTVLIGVLLPWTTAGKLTQPGILSGGVLHAALAVAAIALCVGRGRRDLPARDRYLRARRASLWHLVIGAASVALGGYYLVVFGFQRAGAPGLDIRYGLYVTLAAGMALSYGGFARFWSKHDGDR
jgi:hypothetical protein